MTIIASIKAKDGIVLATDSMTQLIASKNGTVRIVKTYCNAKKLFRIKELNIGVMSYGLGNIGARSIENLLLEFSRELDKHVKEPYTVEGVSSGLLKFVKQIYDIAFKNVTVPERQAHLVLGFFIGGYSAGEFLAEEYEFELPDATGVTQVRKAELCGSSWRGIKVPFGRLYNGFDPRIAGALKEAGVPEETIKNVLDVKKWRLSVAYDGMPVQDAINFAVYLLETTIGAVTFERNPSPSCGGPLQVAVILPDKGWQWVNEPKYSMQ